MSEPGMSDRPKVVEAWNQAADLAEACGWRGISVGRKGDRPDGPTVATGYAGQEKLKVTDPDATKAMCGLRDLLLDRAKARAASMLLAIDAAERGGAP